MCKLGLVCSHVLQAMVAQDEGHSHRLGTYLRIARIVVVLKFGGLAPN